jgi:hypothetical protein
MADNRTVGMRQFGRPSHQWEDKNKMDHSKVSREGMERMHCIYVAQNRHNWQANVKTGIAITSN